MRVTAWAEVHLFKDDSGDAQAMAEEVLMGTLARVVGNREVVGYPRFSLSPIDWPFAQQQTWRVELAVEVTL